VKRLVQGAALGALVALLPAGARADGDPAGVPGPARHSQTGAIVDRVAVRFYAPEMGSSSRPRFVSERTLAFEARLEAEAEGAAGDGLTGGALGSGAYQERYVRSALEHHIAEELLASLQIQTGQEPAELPHLASAARVALTERVGGEEGLRLAASIEGIDATEIDAILRRKARAAYYLDHEISPILHPSEEQLREVFRTSSHPFKGKRFENVREDLLRWFVAERLRVAEAAYLQTARNRVKIVVVAR
jgi:hypothetical protein